MRGHLLEARTAEFGDQMFRAVCVSGDIRQVDLGFHHRGELDLGFFGSLAQSLQSLAVFTQINSLVRLELISRPVDDNLVPVVATQVSVAAGGFDFENTFTYLQHGYIKGTSAQVKDQDLFVLLFIQPVGQG